MKFVLKPSLEHLALIKIAISLWNQIDVRALISQLNSVDLYSRRKWKTIEEKVREKVPHLSLPQLLKEKVFGVIKPIGLEVSMWLEYNHEYLHVNLPADFCWTPQGTVDRKRTAKVLVRNENLNMSIRYELACIYCLEDDIIRFWNRLPEHLKKSVSHRSQMASFWSHNMKRRGSRTDYRSELGDCVEYGNQVAADYFLQKLTPQEREESLVEAAKHANGADTLYFLISEMNEAQQIKIFSCKPYEVLCCFLEWPFQSLFIGVANCLWDFLSKDKYDEILRDIIGKFRDGYKDYNYQNLFREFWQKSPSALKSLITNEIDESELLPSLFSIKDKENTRLILKDATHTAKRKLIYRTHIMKCCKNAYRDNEWDFLEFFIRECLPSKNEMFKFKEKFEKSIMHSYFKESRKSLHLKEHFATQKQKWDQLFNFSDDSVFQYGKRSLEEGESSLSKRFLSLK